jgi:sec-independent protein translocase protein TatA
MTSYILVGIPGVWQIILLVAVVLLFFGGKKIPELMRGLGKGVGEFKKGIREGEDENKESKDNLPKE